MVKIKGIIEEEVKQFLEKKYNLDIIKISYFPLGEDGASYIIKTNDKKYFSKVYRIKNALYTSEKIITVINFLDVVHQEKKLAFVPIPHENNHGKTLSFHKNHPVVLYDYLIGKNLKNKKDLTKKEKEFLGLEVRKLHDIDSKRFKKIPEEKLISPKLNSYTALVKKLNKSYRKNSIKGKLKTLILENDGLYLKTLAYLKKEILYIKSKKKDFVFVHTDLHEGNIMKNKNGLFIIDWDGLERALPEKDLIWFKNGENTNKDFLNGYNKNNSKKYVPNKRALRYYQLKRIWGITIFFSNLILDSSTSKKNARNYLKVLETRNSQLKFLMEIKPSSI